MKRHQVWILVVFALAACGGQTTPDDLATEAAAAQAAGATLTAEATGAAADMVATQVAVARAAAATLTAEAEATSVQAARARATAEPQAAERASQDLGGGWQLMMQEMAGDSQADYGFHVWAPLLVGPDPQVSDPFNRAVDGLVVFSIDDFHQGVSQEERAPGSSLWITHTVTLAEHDLVSIVFLVDGYVEGAAHPFHYSHTLNYDLAQARVLGLSDLFQPEADYLAALSGFSLDALARQGVLEWEDGALPTPENYQRWSITPEGLLIRFDVYAIGPYAAGPQSVLVPYEALRDILDPNGPLAPYVK